MYIAVIASGMILWNKGGVQMGQASLKLVEAGSMDKKKALEAAMGQIERAFGKGSVMKLGQREALDIEAISTGSLGLDIALVLGVCQKAALLKSMVQKVLVKPLWLST